MLRVIAVLQADRGYPGQEKNNLGVGESSSSSTISSSSSTNQVTSSTKELAGMENWLNQPDQLLPLVQLLGWFLLH